MNVGGARQHCTFSDLPDPTKKKGVMLPPFLGIPDACTRPDEIRQIVGELPSIRAPRPSLPFSVRNDRPHDQRLRSRLILNRANGLAAVRHYHNTKDPSPIIRQCPFCIERDVATPETLHHAIAECPKYEVERNKLRAALSSTINAVKRRIRSNDRMAQILHSDQTLFVHIVLATPYIIESTSNVKSRLRLLQLTGQFIDHIHSIKPI